MFCRLVIFNKQIILFKRIYYAECEFTTKGAIRLKKFKTEFLNAQRNCNFVIYIRQTVQH